MGVPHRLGAQGVQETRWERKANSFKTYQLSLDWILERLVRIFSAQKDSPDGFREDAPVWRLCLM